jgi:hypothetical protein
VNTEAAHVRIGGDGGMALKPSDWRTVPLCGADDDWMGHHAYQHQIGERPFWDDYAKTVGQSVEALIDALCRASPKAAEIRKARAERE